MPAAIPIVATIAAGVAASQGAYAIGIAITVAAQVATQLMTKKPSLDAYRDTSERKQVLRAAASPKTVIYGRTMSAGTLFFSEEQPGEQTDGEWLHMAITLAGHPISGIGAIYLSDDDIGTFGNSVSYEVHIDRQTADPFMLANCPSWKADMIGKGISWLRISMKFNAEKFPAGIPNIKVEKLGRKVYDPRTGQTVYSDNAALCILDYYRNYLKVADAEINWDQFQEAANISDEVVINGDNTSEKRYTLNGEFDLSENKASILEAMLACCAGEPTYTAGKHGILVGAYYGPATEVITEDQIAGDIEIMPEVAQADRVNTIKGTFIDPKQGYSEVDFPSVSVAEWVTEDGVEISQDMSLRFVTSEFQAQRLADIKLKRTRISRTMNIPLNLSGYRYRPGMYVKVNLPSLGINNVEMRETDWKFGLNNGVHLTLKQETADVWGDAIGKPIERPPFTQLPIGGVAQPQNLQYTVEEIGQVVQGVLSWQNVGQFAYNKVIIRQDGEMVLSVQVPGSFTRLTGLPRNIYTAHVIAVNQMGAQSPEAYLEFNIQAPTPPSHVDIEQGLFAITLIPRLADLVNVSTQFDFWTSGETQLPNTSDATVEASATRAGIGTTWTSNGLKVGHTYYWYIRTINAFGVSAFVEISGQPSDDFGDISDAIQNELKDSPLFKEIIENAVETSKTIADITTIIAEGADQLAAAIGANRQTAEGIINNALAIADVVVRQSAQNGANSASFTQLREVIATETEARVTDVIRLEAKTDQNAAEVSQLTQALADETQARATAIDTLTAQTEDNTANVTQLTQAVSTLDSSTASRFDELSGKTTNAAGGVQNTAVALIQETLAQVNTRMTLSVQYGANSAGIKRVDSVLVDASKAVAESLKTLDVTAGGNANVTDFAKTMSDFTQTSATRINSLSVTVNGQAAAITTNAQAVADINGNLTAMYSIKVGVDSNGVQYAAGMGLGVQNTPTGMQSQVIFLADRFAVMSQPGAAVTLPFVIQNGQTFIRDTIIQDGSITNAKIGAYIQSNNYVAGSVGWRIGKDGSSEFSNVTVRGALYATSGNFSFNGVNNSVVIDGTGVLINLAGGGSIKLGVW